MALVDPIHAQKRTGGTGMLFFSFIFVPYLKLIIMARQVSLLKLEGKIGDLSFFKDKRGHQARMKSGPTKEQINSDPRFQRTKENGQEFGRAAQASKKLREQLRELLRDGADSQISNRLTGRMLRILRADLVNGRGDRLVLAGNLPQLVGLECNVRSQLKDVLFLKVKPSYDSFSGEATLELPAMIVKNVIKKLEGATHVQIQFAAVEFDAQNPDVDAVAVARSNYLDMGKSESMPMEVLSLEMEAQPTSAVLFLIGVSYYQLVNGGYYPLTNGVYNALTFVQVYLA